MEELFASYDARCPDSLFTFLANSEEYAGEFTKFALPFAAAVGTIEELRAMSPQAVQSVCEGLGMPGDAIVAALKKTSDSRFEGVKTFNGVEVKPLPRWTLLVSEIFDILDVDKNGTLDLGEYMALATMGASPFSFFFADKDGNGSVDAAEFLALHVDSPAAAELTETELEACCLSMKKHLQERKPMLKSQVDREALLTRLFEVFDADGDGEIDYFEFQQYTTNPDMEEMMALWFTAIDSQGNSDGKIQLSEFLKTMGMLNQHMTDMKFEMWLMNIIELISPH